VLRQLYNDGKPKARRTIKSFDHTFSKGGWQPQPKKVIRTIFRRTDLGAEDSRNFLGTEEKIVFLTSFFKPLIKVWPAKHRQGELSGGRR
jgi:hypothetical protein